MSLSINSDYFRNQHRRFDLFNGDAFVFFEVETEYEY
jgi:hypothetical protein